LGVVDGVVPGKASLDAEELLKIIQMPKRKTFNFIIVIVVAIGNFVIKTANVYPFLFSWFLTEE